MAGHPPRWESQCQLSENNYGRRRSSGGGETSFSISHQGQGSYASDNYTTTANDHSSAPTTFSKHKYCSNGGGESSLSLGHTGQGSNDCYMTTSGQANQDSYNTNYNASSSSRPIDSSRFKGLREERRDGRGLAGAGARAMGKMGPVAGAYAPSHSIGVASALGGGSNQNNSPTEVSSPQRGRSWGGGQSSMGNILSWGGVHTPNPQDSYYRRNRNTGSGGEQRYNGIANGGSGGNPITGDYGTQSASYGRSSAPSNSEMYSSSGVNNSYSGRHTSSAPDLLGASRSTPVGYGGGGGGYGRGGAGPPQTFSSNVYASGANQNSGNFISDRPTSRVLAPPGGFSSFTLG